MPKRKQDIWIVDDEPAICRMIECSLAEAGIPCRTTTDPLVVVPLLERQAVRVLVADVAMPHVSGLDLLVRAKCVAPDCKVILITGATRSEDISLCLALGAYDYIQKPIRHEDLVQTVRDAAAGSTVSKLVFRAAQALEVNHQIREAALGSIRALVWAVEAKDPHTRRHSEHVAFYARNIAAGLDCDSHFMATLHTAAMLHDVGKIGVPDCILTKEGPLTDVEFAYIRRHPGTGADILAQVPLFAEEAKLVRYHHERWDGRGYPEGLAGDMIPLGARIVQVSDCVDAMLMARSYKQGYPVSKVLDELERCSGTQFDPNVASAGHNWIRQNPDKLFLPKGQAGIAVA